MSAKSIQVQPRSQNRCRIVCASLAVAMGLLALIGVGSPTLAQNIGAPESAGGLATQGAEITASIETPVDAPALTPDGSALDPSSPEVDHAEMPSVMQQDGELPAAVPADEMQLGPREMEGPSDSASSPADAAVDLDGSGIDATTSAQAVPAWRAYWDYLGADLDTVANTARTDGYRPISISAYNTTSTPRYAAVFVARSGPPWRLLRGTGASNFGAVFSTQASQSYKPALLSFDGSATDPVWAVVFVHSTAGIPYTRHMLVSGDINSDTTIQFWLKKARLERLIPTSLSIYGTIHGPVSDARYAIVLEPNTANVEWTVGRINANQSTVWGIDGMIDTPADYQARWNAQVPARNRPALIDLQQNKRYVEMFRDDSLGPLAGRHSLTSASLGTEMEAWKQAGLFPITIQGGGSGSSVRFAALFAQSELPQPRAFTARGSSATGDKAVASIDNAMRDFMARNNVRQASLAIASNRRLVYARGYTFAEAGYPLTEATTHFRMASVSKTVTAMEILWLVDRNVVKLTDTVQSILELRKPDGEKPDAKFGTITIENLLAHDYPSLTVGRARKCLLRDGRVGKEVADAFKTSLPVTMMQSVRYSLSLPLTDLIRDPPDDGYCGGNFAYNLLALVVANKRGKSFTSALQSDLFSPLGITRFRIASSDINAQPANEAIYRSYGLWTDKSINSPAQPLVSAPYGSDGNWTAVAGSGGMSMAATDMVRLLANLNVRTSNWVYTDATIRTITQFFGTKPFGFDRAVSDTTGTHWVKGGLINGLQSEAYYTQSGISYVIYWAHNEVPNSGNAADNWYPTWGTLNTAIAGASLGSRADLFPTYGMRSFPAPR